ncbi:hypothetical protein [Clostridium sp.]|uniref:hypothetical protein n=1 Tax=Clostridium sp. TaxID=1506 RepID=UPI001D208F26|nr:hypothetical protein [Clostridium sp.]MBS5306486.1 hypothetical protein [Clostridium sp.]MDU3406695.1 hypothetical protein [Clostridium sp.]
MFIVNPMENGEFFLSDTNEGFEVSKELTEEVYNELESNKKVGKIYKLKNINGTTFEEIFEEHIPEIEIKEEIGLEEIALDHEFRISKLELGV